MDTPKFNAEEIASFVQKHSKFDFDEVSHDPAFVVFSTNENCYNGSPGQTDINRAGILKSLLLACIDHISVEISYADEFVILQVNEKKPCRKAPVELLLF